MTTIPDPDPYPNDADIAMAELAEAGNDIARGVCPACTDVLDPHAERWRNDPRWAGQPAERERWAQMLGPESAMAEGYHARCLEGGGG